MKIEVYVQESGTGQVYDISSLCREIQHETFLDGQPGKLTTSTEKDINIVLRLTNGSRMSVIIDGVGIFFGYVFEIETSEESSYKILAYDQLRYLKNSEYYITKNQTASQIFEMICKEWQLKYNIKYAPKFVCPLFNHEDKTLSSIIDYGIKQTLINENKKCFIRDDFGVIVFSELQQEKTDLIIGEKSLLTNYTHKKSIDTDTFNEVKLVRDNEETGKRDVWIVFDSNNQKRWGKLRLLQKADKNLNEAEVAELANNLLKLKNKETKSLKLTTIGDKRLKVGMGFVLYIERLEIKQYVWITTIAHTYTNDFHNMVIEVFI